MFTQSSGLLDFSLFEFEDHSPRYQVFYTAENAFPVISLETLVNPDFRSCSRVDRGRVALHLALYRMWRSDMYRFQADSNVELHGNVDLWNRGEVTVRENPEINYESVKRTTRLQYRICTEPSLRYTELT